jgi:indolepyruvate ferredoxin oxidoreductase
VGGTGIVTIGAILGMASHLEGKQVLVLDMAGLSQKGGAVSSHIRISAKADEHFSARIPHDSADVLIGADLLVSASKDCLPLMSSSRTQVILNSDIQATGDFVTNPDWGVDPLSLKQKLISKTKVIHEVKATELATRLIGDAVATNMFLLGYAWQKGFIPLRRESIMKAIEINGVSIKQNNLSFLWGQNAACQPDRVPDWLGQNSSQPIQWIPRPVQANLNTLVQDRSKRLEAYQSKSYAKRYEEFVQQVHAQELKLTQGEELSVAVAKNLFKLMAYKDEYEVARLHSSTHFLEDLKAKFDGPVTVKFHLAPPGLAKRDENGHLRKSAYGSWVYKAFQFLAKMKWLRGTALDVFGYTEERKQERRLIQSYSAAILEVMGGLNTSNLNKRKMDIALQIAALPHKVRGFGHVKENNMAQFNSELERLTREFVSIQ